MLDFKTFADLSEKALEIILGFKGDGKYEKKISDEINKLKKDIRKTIGLLLADEKEVLELRYYGNLTCDEISKHTKRSKEEVNKILQGAIKKLKEKLREKDFETTQERKQDLITQVAKKPPEPDIEKISKRKSLISGVFSLIFLLFIFIGTYFLIQKFFFARTEVVQSRDIKTSLQIKRFYSKHIKISGSTSFLKLSSMWDEAFKTSFPKYKITLLSSDSNKGIKELINGKVDIANSSRPIIFSDQRKSSKKEIELVEHRVALDALVVIVNKNNPFDELSIEDLEKIFNGEIKNWSLFGNFNQVLLPIVREKGSGTNDFVLSRIVKASDFPLQITKKKSSEEIFKLISKNPGAISYINSGNYPWADKDIKYIKVKSFPDSLSYSPFVGKKLNEQLIRYGDYPLSHYLYLITTSESTKAVQDFINWVLSPKGQQIVSNFGLIPVYVEED